MKVSNFDFDLPRERIAQEPASPKDSARLLHVDETFADLVMTDLPDNLSPGDLLVFNDTKVIPSRLVGKRLDAVIEVTLHKEVSDNSWWAFARPGRRLNEGDIIDFTGEFSAKICEKRGRGEVRLSFDCGQQYLRDML